MAKIPRGFSQQFEGFDPQKPPMIPLSIGANNWGEAFGKASQTGFDIYNKKKQAQEEVAINRLEQNLITSEGDAEVRIAGGFKDLPHHEWEDAAAETATLEQYNFLQDEQLHPGNLSPANDLRREQMLFKSLARIKSKARLAAVKAMGSELVATEDRKQAGILNGMVSNPSVEAAIVDLEAYGADLRKRVPQNFAFNPAQAEASIAALEEKGYKLAITRIVSELANSIEGEGSALTSHLKVKHSEDLVKLIQTPNFKKYFDTAASGGLDKFINKVMVQLHTSKIAIRKAKRLQDKRIALDEYKELKLLATKGDFVDPNKVAAVMSKILDMDMDVRDVMPIVNSLSSLPSDVSKPTEAEELLYQNAINALKIFVVTAKRNNAPVDEAGFNKQFDTDAYGKMHPTSKGLYMDYFISIMEPRNQDIATLSVTMTDELIQGITAPYLKPGAITDKVYYMMQNPGSLVPGISRFNKDLEGVIGASVERYVRDWARENPDKPIDRSKMMAQMYNDFTVGEFLSPTIIDIDPTVMKHVLEKREHSPDKLSPREKWVASLIEIKQARLAEGIVRFEQIAKDHKLGPGGVPPEGHKDRPFYIEFSKMLNPGDLDFQQSLVDYKASGQKLRLEMEAFRNSDAYKAATVDGGELSDVGFEAAIAKHLATLKEPLSAEELQKSMSVAQEEGKLPKPETSAQGGGATHDWLQIPVEIANEVRQRAKTLGVDPVVMEEIGKIFNVQPEAQAPDSGVGRRGFPDDGPREITEMIKQSLGSSGLEPSVEGGDEELVIEPDEEEGGSWFDSISDFAGALKGGYINASNNRDEVRKGIQEYRDAQAQGAGEEPAPIQEEPQAKKKAAGPTAYQSTLKGAGTLIKGVDKLTDRAMKAYDKVTKVKSAKGKVPTVSKSTFSEHDALFAHLDKEKTPTLHMATIAKILERQEAAKGQVIVDQTIDKIKIDGVPIPAKLSDWIRSSDPDLIARLEVSGGVSSLAFLKILKAEFSKKDVYSDERILNLVTDITYAIKTVGLEEEDGIRLASVLDIVTAEVISRNIKGLK